MIYFIILILIIVNIIIFDLRNKSRNRKKISYILLSSIIVLTVIFSYCLGSDGIRYFKWFPAYPTFEDFTYDYIKHSNYESGWIILNIFARSTFNDFFIVNLLSAGLVSVVILVIFFKYSSYPFTCLLFYYFISFFHFSFEILRQDCALIFFLWGVCALLNNNNKKEYLIKALPSVLFHSSAIIIYMLTYLASFFKINRKYLIIPIIIFLFSSTITYIFPQIVLYLSFHEIDYADKINYYMTSAQYGISEKNFFDLIKFLFANILVPIFLLYFYARDNRLITIRQLVYLYLLFKCLIPVMSIFYRFCSYFEIFYFMLLSDYFINGIKKHFFTLKKIVLYSCIFIMLFIYARMYLSSDKFNTHDSDLDFRYFPYTSVFNSDDEVIMKRKLTFN